MRTIDQARRELREALASADPTKARRALRGIPPVRDPEAGLLWAELLWGVPDHPDRLALAQTLLDAFPERGEIVRPCAEILIDSMGPYVPGQPAPQPTLARRAAEAARTCLSLRPDYDQGPQALLLHTLAAALSRDPEASDAWVEQAWEQALTLAPDDGSVWFGAGLWLKYRGRFRPALAALLRARDLMGAGQAILWNIGICATGCARSDVALQVWEALGLPVTDRDGRVTLDSPAPRRIRLVTTDPVYGSEGSKHAIYDLLLTPGGPCDGTLAEEAGPFTAGQRWVHDGTPIATWTDQGGEEHPILPALAPLS